MSATPETDALVEQFGYAVASDDGCTCPTCSLREHGRKLERQRNELLGACKCALDLGVDTYAAEVIRAAIARAEVNPPHTGP